MAKIKCKTYNTIKEFDTVKEAKEFFMDCIRCSEGAERDRYLNVYFQLEEGLEYCTDDRHGYV